MTFVPKSFNREENTKIALLDKTMPQIFAQL